MHTMQKSIKSYLRGAQVSALSEKIEKLFKVLCKFSPLIGPPSYKMTRKGQICTTVALSGGQICKESWITPQFPQIMQKFVHLVGNFWCPFVWCALFWPQRLFEVTEVVMSFSQKQRPRLGIWIQKKCFKCFSTLFLMLYNIHFLIIWLTIVGAILEFFQKVAGPLLQRSLIYCTRQKYS